MQRDDQYMMTDASTEDQTDIYDPSQQFLFQELAPVEQPVIPDLLYD